MRASTTTTHPAPLSGHKGVHPRGQEVGGRLLDVGDAPRGDSLQIEAQGHGRSDQLHLREHLTHHGVLADTVHRMAEGSIADVLGTDSSSVRVL